MDNDSGIYLYHDQQIVLDIALRNRYMLNLHKYPKNLFFNLIHFSFGLSHNVEWKEEKKNYQIFFASKYKYN